MSKGNLTITVARKPVGGTVASNALQWGTGALNIDACRICTSDKVTLHPNLNVRERGVRRMYDGGDIPPITEEHQTAGQALGRWPSNLILVHNAGCRKTGARKVQGNRADTRPEGDGGREDRSQWRFRPTSATRRGYSDEDGLETVDAWECEPTCPCRVLDEQSGPGQHLQNTDVKWGGNQDFSGCSSYHGSGVVTSRYFDGGGASRFFKQVQVDE